jgi:photosystem II stability/assembly factor-like uncharacterized protein
MSDYLDRVEAQLTELTERGAHQRFRARHAAGRVMGGGFGRPGPGGPHPPRRRGEALAFLAAAAVVAAVVAIVLVNAHGPSRHSNASSAAPATATHSATTAPGRTATSTTPSRTTPTTGSLPIPGRFAPQSFTAVSELTWWLLGPAPCTFAGTHPPCGAILRTTDGGRSYSAIEAPRASLAGRVAASGYSQIRFANLLNGFAYGPDLYATHDGGTTWHRVDVGGMVDDLAISDGEAYAVVTSSRGGPDHLMRSPVGQDQWSTVPAAGHVSGGVWVLGRVVIAQSGNTTGMLVSTDGAASFASHPAPSPGLPCDFQAQSPAVIWAHCATGTESGVWRSTNGGASFPSAVSSSAHLMLPNSAVFAAASDTTAVVGYQRLYRTADAGATWTPVEVPGVVQWAYLGFTDATHGVGLGYVGSIAPANERLYYTTDGGQSYHLVPLP